MTSRAILPVLAGAALSMLSASVGTSAANVALPELAEFGGGSLGHAQGVAVAYLVAMTAASLIVGGLGDRFGHQRTLAVGAALFSVAALACAAAPSLGALVVFRAIQGVGASAMMALPLALARELAEKNHLGRTLGLLGTVAAIGTASGPALGGALMSFSDWRAVFWAMVPLGTLAALLSALPGHRGVHDNGAPLAPKSAGTFRTVLFPLALPMVLGGIVGAIMMSTLVIGPFYLSAALGLSAAAVGAAMAAGPCTSVLTGFLMGRVVDRFGAERMSIVGLAGMMLGTTCLALLPPLWGLPGYLCGTMLLAPGYQLFLAANTAGALHQVEQNRRGAASGLLSLARNLGMIAGASLVAGFFAMLSGTAHLTDAAPTTLDIGLRSTFLLSSAVLLCGLLLARKQQVHKVTT